MGPAGGESAQDFLDELGALALGSRLKRLGDRMMAEASRTYRAFGHEVQPKWFGLLALLHSEGPVGIVQAARRLGLTQPAVSQFCQDLEARGWIAVRPDAQDARKRRIELTRRGRSTVASMQPMWRAVQQVAERLCREAGDDFLASIRRLENALAERPIAERALEHTDGARRRSRR
jgi:DNA-binding MarR family transcriptional regulator